MEYHILNGDALKAQFPIDEIGGRLIVCKECLIEGDISGETLAGFWKNRTQFFVQNYGEAAAIKYKKQVLPEFQKILALPPDAIIHLWFGDDLFCQMNLCFIISLLEQINRSDNIFLVKAQLENWHEFGAMSTEELILAYQQKKHLTPEDFQLLLDCWYAFQTSDLAQLKILAKSKSPIFPVLEACLQAHIDRFPLNSKQSRPQQKLLNIQSKLQTDNFGKIFQQFTQEEGIYGFGDLQVKKLYDTLN